MVISRNDMHSLNASLSILTTEEGIDTLVNDEHPSNALDIIDVTPYGIVIFFASIKM